MKPSPFATFLIIGPTCFFLGLLFSNFPYDYYVLWASPPSTTSDVFADREPYFAQLETHLRILHASPPLINRILHIVIGTGLIGIISKLYKPTESNMLFDGASLVLYMVGVTVYIANIVKGLRVVTSGVYGEADPENPEFLMPGKEGIAGGVANDMIVGREDTLRVFAASNTILALVLVGVLILQAGQWYAQKKEDAEIEEMDRVAAAKKTEKEKEGHKSPTKGEKKKQ